MHISRKVAALAGITVVVPCTVACSSGGSSPASGSTPSNRASIPGVLLGDGVRVTCTITGTGYDAALDIGVTASQPVSVSEVIFTDATGNGNYPVTLNIALDAGQSYHTSFPAAALSMSSCKPYTWLSPDGMQHP